MHKKFCFYNQPTCNDKMTREHIISASVLKAVFGDPIRNFISAEFLGTKTLVDNEPVIRDVCEICNNERLSPYDEAGIGFIKQLLPSHDPTGLRIVFSHYVMGWILKTHLNYIRVIRDRETNRIYPINEEIKCALIQHAKFPYDRFKLYIQGWVGEPFYWDSEDPRRIPWFSYRSVRFRSQRIVISDLRIKTLITWIVIPSDDTCDNLNERMASALDEANRDFGFNCQLVNPDQAIEAGYIDLNRVLPVSEVRKYISYR